MDCRTNARFPIGLSARLGGSPAWRVVHPRCAARHVRRAAPRVDLPSRGQNHKRKRHLEVAQVFVSHGFSGRTAQGSRLRSLTCEIRSATNLRSCSRHAVAVLGQVTFWPGQAMRLRPACITIKRRDIRLPFGGIAAPDRVPGLRRPTRFCPMKGFLGGLLPGGVSGHEVIAGLGSSAQELIPGGSTGPGRSPPLHRPGPAGRRRCGLGRGWQAPSRQSCCLVPGNECCCECLQGLSPQEQRTPMMKKPISWDPKPHPSASRKIQKMR